MAPINLSTSGGIFAWEPAAWLRVTGEDAATFLQGQFTNELRGLAAGAAVYGLWLTVKGKVLADSFVLRGFGPDEFWVGSYGSAAAVIRERLEAFVIADDVVIEDATAEWAGLSVVGVDAAELTSAPPTEGFVFAGRRVRSGGMEWVFPRASISSARARFSGAREMGNDEIATLRIRDAIPAVPIDIGPADLPNEGGLEVEAISFTKGCYLGQEVMARLKSMGKVRRRLLRVRGIGADAALPPTPAPVFAGAKQVGELRSVARDADGRGWIGLAMVSLMNVAPDSTLSFATDGAAHIQLVDTP